jgi:hypothetical protein
MIIFGPFDYVGLWPAKNRRSGGRVSTIPFSYFQLAIWGRATRYFIGFSTLSSSFGMVQSANAGWCAVVLDPPSVAAFSSAMYLDSSRSLKVMLCHAMSSCLFFLLLNGRIHNRYCGDMKKVDGLLSCCIFSFYENYDISLCSHLTIPLSKTLSSGTEPFLQNYIFSLQLSIKIRQ